MAFIRDAFDPSFSWDDAEWLCQEWNEGPVALKGVVRPSDALKAVDRGFDAVWVSNHGGRQLETAPAPIDVLPSIRDAMGGVGAWHAAKTAEEDAWRDAAINDGADLNDAGTYQRFAESGDGRRGERKPWADRIRRRLRRVYLSRSSSTAAFSAGRTF